MSNSFRTPVLLLTLHLLSSAPVFAGPLDNCQEFVKYGIPSERGALPA